MLEGLKKILKIITPIAIGSFIVYLFFKNLNADDINRFKNYFKQANYWWVLLAILFTLLSHISRAIRWQMMMKSLGYSLGFMSSMYALFVNYLVNLGIPRTGELARCGVLAKYNKIPFNKSFGALVNERVIDVLFLGFTGLMVFIFQYDVFITFSQNEIFPIIKSSTLFQNKSIVILIAVLLFIMFLAALYLLKIGKFPLQEKFSKAFSGIIEGLLSIKQLKNPFGFIFHSVFIWIMYWLMTFVVFFAVEGGDAITLMSALTVLFFGTFAFIVVSGGLGAYPFTLGLVVSLYGMNSVLGNAVGWLLWGGQSVLIVGLGALSFFMLSLQKSEET